MFKTIYWYSYFMLSAFSCYPKLLKIKKYLKEGKVQEAEKLTHEVTSHWAMQQIKNAGATIKVDGIDNIPKDEPVVFISNHQGNFDIAIFMACIPTFKGYVAKIETKKIPIIRTWMTYMHCIFMDRSTLKTAAQAIVDGIKVIKEGHSLVIFPEGTRSKGDEIGEFKAGSFKLATKPKVPIVPVTINGSYKLMEAQGGKLKSDTVYVTIHPPIATSTLTKEELAVLPDTVKHMIASKLPEALKASH